MKTAFFKRLGAYLIDFVIVTLIVSVVTMGFKVNNNNLIEEMNEVATKRQNEEISMEEYSEKLLEINYDYQKSVIPNTIASVIISFGYFVVFACLNKGQTLGKKIFKIKVVTMDNKAPKIGNMLLRSIFLYGMLSGIANVVCIYFFKPKIFNEVSMAFYYITYTFIIVCLFMTMYKKDGRGLHDIIGRTYVKEEVK